MARSIERKTDGISIEEYHARFTGRVLLEEEDLNATALEEIGVGVVVFKSDGVGTSINRKGTVIRTAVLKVTDLRVLDGDLKKLLVERLGLYGDDTAEPAMVGGGKSIPPEFREEYEASVQQELPFGDPKTGEIPDVVELGDPNIERQVNEEMYRLFEAEQPDGVVGSIHAHRENAVAGTVSRNGVKVMPFTDHDLDGAPGEREVVGRVRQSSDPALQRFFEDLS